MENKCAVKGCRELASYRIVQIWYGRYPEEDEHSQIDDQCPYICHDHMVENEESFAPSKTTTWQQGMLKTHPYTGTLRHNGGLVYEPLEVSHTLLYQNQAKNSEILVRSLNAELIVELRRRPELVFNITPQRFEEVVAELFRNQGFEVELTPATRDGGVDIYAASKDVSGSLLYVVECKLNSPTHKVGIGVVQRIYGVAQQKGANKGVVVTTSTFSKDARSFAAPLRYYIGLREYSDFVDWLKVFKLQNERE